MTEIKLKVVARLVSACVLAAAAAGCESNTQVGSECKGGVCPRATPVSTRVCAATSTHVEVAQISAADENAPSFGALCLARPLPTGADGKIACSVQWTLNATEGEDRRGDPEIAPPWPLKCSDVPFLTPVGDADDVCLVTQLSPDEREAGEDGWYYDTSLGEGDDPQCYGSSPGIRFTKALARGSFVTVEVSCGLTLALAGDELVAVDAEECAAPEAEAVEVGAACTPSFSPGSRGFDPREAWVEARSSQCDEGPCLIYALDGDPSPDCEPSETHVCPSAAELERSMYCSCRCDAPAGDPGSLCDCADGFTCLEVMPEGPPGIRGSYCVSNRQISDR